VSTEHHSFSHRLIWVWTAGRVSQPLEIAMRRLLRLKRYVKPKGSQSPSAPKSFEF
jgi:hypothetical protein